MKTFVALVVLAGLVALAKADTDFQTCPGFSNDAWVNPIHVSISPDPLVAKKGQEVHIHFDVNLIQTLEVGNTIKITMNKGGVPLPCVTVPGLPIKLGSCSFDGQEILDLLPKEWCDKYAKSGCKLPLKPGFYGDSNPKGFAAVTIPDIPSILVPILSGDLTVKAQVVQDGTEVICVQNTVHITA